jgi:hypothetical protein
MLLPPPLTTTAGQEHQEKHGKVDVEVRGLFEELAVERSEAIFLLGSLMEMTHQNRPTLHPNARTDKLKALLSEIFGLSSAACNSSRHRIHAATNTRAKMRQIQQSTPKLQRGTRST